MIDDEDEENIEETRNFIEDFDSCEENNTDEVGELQAQEFNVNLQNMKEIWLHSARDFLFLWRLNYRLIITSNPITSQINRIISLKDLIMVKIKRIVLKVRSQKRELLPLHKRRVLCNKISPASRIRNSKSN